MQGKEREDRQLMDAGALVGHLVPAGSMFAFLAAHRQELFLDEDFADLFPSGKGRPSVPASVMASVMVLQVLHDYSDAEAAEAARCDLRWKAACGFPLGHEGFDPSTLVYWRRRVARSVDWDDPQAKDALVSALVNDANALVAALKDRELGEQAASAVGLLALVAGQDAGPAEGSDGTDGRWRIARKVAGDRVISTVDPEARHTRKSPENRRDGYRAHVAACPETGIITGEGLTRAAGEENSDAAAAGEFLAGQAAGGGPPCEWYGDSAYGTGDLRAAIRQAGHTAVIKPRPLKPAVEGGFTLDDFTVDETAHTVTCPAGVTRPVTARRNVTFGAACRGCPLRARCTTSKHGRALILHEHDALLRAARAGWAAQPGLREDYRKFRPNVERVISQIASRGGRRLRLRYLGTARNNAWLKHRTAALNLRNLISRGLTRDNGAWVLA